MIQNLFISALLFFLISCASGHHQPFEETLAPVRDISGVRRSIQTAVSASSCLSLKEIGNVEYGVFQAPLWCVSFRMEEPITYRILVNAGIHGNEPAGVACILHLLEQLAQHPDQYRSIAIDIIPMVNPWGWVHDIRFNRDGTDINRDFSTFNSQEAGIMKKFIKGRRYDLMLDLHEDPGAGGFYIYQYGIDDKTAADDLIDTIKKMGHPIEENVSMVILKTENGIIDAPVWGLWYMRLTGQLTLSNYYRLNNSQQVYTIETPTALPMKDRLSMQLTAVEVLISANAPEPWQLKKNITVWLHPN